MSTPVAAPLTIRETRSAEECFLAARDAEVGIVVIVADPPRIGSQAQLVARLSLLLPRFRVIVVSAADQRQHEPAWRELGAVDVANSLCEIDRVAAVVARYLTGEQTP